LQKQQESSKKSSNSIVIIAKGGADGEEVHLPITLEELTTALEIGSYHGVNLEISINGCIQTAKDWKESGAWEELLIPEPSKPNHCKAAFNALRSIVHKAWHTSPASAYRSLRSIIAKPKKNPHCEEPLEELLK
jgi:hypothetical protein